MDSGQLNPDLTEQSVPPRVAPNLGFSNWLDRCFKESKGGNRYNEKVGLFLKQDLLTVHDGMPYVESRGAAGDWYLVSKLHRYSHRA